MVVVCMYVVVAASCSTGRQHEVRRYRDAEDPGLAIYLYYCLLQYTCLYLEDEDGSPDA